MEKVLRRGYTTGVHTSFAFKNALSSFIATNELSISKTNKMDNDDLDVTKGCEIVVHVGNSLEDLELNSFSHSPYILKNNSAKMFLYAGVGVGVVTKEGLKPPKGFPAINPKPLQALEDLFFSLYSGEKDLYVSVSVTNGEEIAKETANAKVGVLGGISILGTTGFVKPVSSSAYLDSIETEINFALTNGFSKLFFTLGNSAYEKALESESQASIIEIGNFLYDAFHLALEKKAKEVVFICGIGKMSKLYQGFKNTHNRFGVIDFNSLQKDIEKELGFCVDTEVTLTVKGICQQLQEVGLLEKFYEMIIKGSEKVVKEWFEDLNFKLVILDDKEVKGW